jgi:uncharacterized protein (TIRG00374 family)
VTQATYKTPLVLEETVLKHRIRRPSDLARAGVALISIAGVGLLAYVAHRTTSGIDQDISIGANRLPAVVILAANLVSGLSAIIFPSVVSIDMLMRRRGRQLIEAIGGLLLSVLILTTASWFLLRYGSDRVISSFSGTLVQKNAKPFNMLLGGFAAFITVSRMMSRARWNVFCITVLGSIALASVVSGGITAAGLGVSALLGWAVGLLIRYALGTDTTRPAGRDIGRVLEGMGHPLKWLKADEVSDSGRRYAAMTVDEQRLELVVFDRDLEGAHFLPQVYRSLRLREDPGGSGTSMRASLERMALNSWAASTAGIPTPHLLSVAEVGPDAGVLVFEYMAGKSFAELDGALGDAELVSAWEIVRDLQIARIGHRTLTADHFLRASDGRVHIIGLEDGAVAASDVILRIDLAEALCTLALLAGPDRAISAARIVLGDAGLIRALPALQPVALSTKTRALTKDNKDLLSQLRATLLELIPEGTGIEQVEIERIKPRTLITIAAGTIAAYILIAQLGRVDVIKLLHTANPGWMLLGLGLSVTTYVASAMTLMSVVPERLSFFKTFLTQWAASFATLVTPPTLGSVTINVRFLTQQRISNALAGASVAVAQVLTFLSHTTLFLIMAIAAGTSKDLTFTPPRLAIIVIVTVALILVFLTTIPKVRAIMIKRISPFISQVIPRLTSLTSRPAKLATGVVGVLMLNLSYCLCLIASVRAFTPNGSIAAISLVYLAGSVVAQAAPTPGGLGAVEAAIAAGLSATGVNADVAVSATLVFRLWTFWIPTIPGWFAFRQLQKTGDL